MGTTAASGNNVLKASNAAQLCLLFGLMTNRCPVIGSSGYVLTADLVREVAAGAALKPQQLLFKLEDIAMGSWVEHIAQERNVHVSSYANVTVFMYAHMPMSQRCLSFVMRLPHLHVTYRFIAFYTRDSDYLHPDAPSDYTPATVATRRSAM